MHVSQSPFLCWNSWTGACWLPISGLDLLLCVAFMLGRQYWVRVGLLGWPLCPRARHETLLVCSRVHSRALPLTPQAQRWGRFCARTTCLVFLAWDFFFFLCRSSFFFCFWWCFSFPSPLPPTPTCMCAHTLRQAPGCKTLLMDCEEILGCRDRGRTVTIPTEPGLTSFTGLRGGSVQVLG